MDLHHPFTESEEHPDQCAVCGSKKVLDHVWSCEHMSGNGTFACTHHG
jgi:hypothetical protein